MVVGQLPCAIIIPSDQWYFLIYLAVIAGQEVNSHFAEMIFFLPNSHLFVLNVAVACVRH